MSKLATRIYDKWFAQKRPAKRGFAAAKITRQNRDWTATTYGANWTLYRDLRTLRARAREMAKNAPHFRKFLKMAERNVVGSQGHSAAVHAMLGSAKTLRPNTKLNSMVETALGMVVQGKLQRQRQALFCQAQKLFLRHLIRDGEALVQHVAAGNPFGYALKFWNVDWLDEMYNEELGGGRRIIMSSRSMTTIVRLPIG
jgi:capsid protein